MLICSLIMAFGGYWHPHFMLFMIIFYISSSFESIKPVYTILMSTKWCKYHLCPLLGLCALEREYNPIAYSTIHFRISNKNKNEFNQGGDSEATGQVPSDT